MFIKGIQRPIAATVLVTFLALVLQPLAVLAQDRPTGNRSATRSETGEERFSRMLNEIHELLKEVAPQAAMPHMFAGKPGEKQLRAIGPNLLIETEAPKLLPGVDVAKKVGELRSKVKELLALEDEVRKGFAATEKHIKDKKLPEVILARHEEAVRAYEARSAEFKVLAGNVERAADAGGPALQTTLAELGTFMAKYPNQRTHTPTDPNNLPWGSPKPVKRAPYTTPEQFKTSGLFKEHEEQQLARRMKERRVKVAQSGSLSGIGLPSTQLPSTPEPADLAETEDVQLTAAIRAKAAELGNQPVAIYNWVRNNIEFIPSYGSIQGSDMTLQTKRGNAFDTASLLIALMRAANIPTRYVYGTIEMPVEQAMNWVGGVTVPEAAQSLMGQGGIPNLGIAEAGRVKWIRLEHVWVEAYVDYVPSRGAVHRQGDTWVPLDASFKQFEYTPGMDVNSNVPFDAQSFINQIEQNATINEQEGWASNVDQNLVQQAKAQYQIRVTNYINSQKPNATVGDIQGTQAIVQEGSKILHGTLPYRTLVTASKFQTVADNLRWKFRYNLYANEYDRAVDNPFVSFVLATPSIAGKSITLSFAPETQQDSDTINSYLPQAHADGSPIQINELPQSLPGYLIRLVPELRLDRQVLARGPAFTMGSELIQSAAYWSAASGQWQGGDDNRPVAGEYIATAVNLQGGSGIELTRLAARLDATRAALTQSPPNAITKEAFAGELLYSGILAYFAAIDQAGSLGAKATGVISQRMPSYGNFGSIAQSQFSFGVPRSVRFSGLQIDVDRIVGADIAKNSEEMRLIAFRKTIGEQYSALEHQVPEQLFRSADSTVAPNGVSAVKAISVAAAEGQRIYTLTSANEAIHSIALSGLAIDSSVKQELANALAAGKEVTVHAANVSVAGFTGVGYIIIDPATGAGAYKISGGANGGFLSAHIQSAIALAAFVLDAMLSLGVGSAYAQDVDKAAKEVATIPASQVALCFEYVVAFIMLAAIAALIFNAAPLPLKILLVVLFVIVVALVYGACFGRD
jgi:transglutaminase-like putative cysteine protease